MEHVPTVRFSIRMIMMFVLTTAVAAALFVKIRQLANANFPSGWSADVPALVLLGIALTAVALGSWKGHTAVQIMLQTTLACFALLTLIWIGESHYERPVRYWGQAVFAATVTLPMLARRFVKTSMPRGPRRTWWKKTCEAVFFSFLTVMLVALGGVFQLGLFSLGPISTTPVAPAPTALPLPPSLPPGVPPPPLYPPLPSDMPVPPASPPDGDMPGPGPFVGPPAPPR